MYKFKNTAHIVSLQTGALLMAIVAFILFLGKIHVIEVTLADLWVEAIILIFGGIILTIETFKESKLRINTFSSVITVVTILSTFLSAGLKLYGVKNNLFLESLVDPFIFLGLSILLVYELFLENRLR